MSMHNRCSPVCFGTTTRLVTHSGCITSRMILAFSIFLTSYTMNPCFLGSWRCAFCFTVLALGHTTKWCSITSQGTRVMSTID